MLRAVPLPILNKAMEENGKENIQVFFFLQNNPTKRNSSNCEEFCFITSPSHSKYADWASQFVHEDSLSELFSLFQKRFISVFFKCSLVCNFIFSISPSLHRNAYGENSPRLASFKRRLCAAELAFVYSIMYFKGCKF